MRQRASAVARRPKMSLQRRAVLLIVGLLALAATAQLAVTTAVFAYGARRGAFEWLRGSLANGGRQLDEEYFHHLETDAADLAADPVVAAAIDAGDGAGVVERAAALNRLNARGELIVAVAADGTRVAAPPQCPRAVLPARPAHVVARCGRGIAFFAGARTAGGGHVFGGRVIGREYIDRFSHISGSEAALVVDGRVVASSALDRDGREIPLVEPSAVDTLELAAPDISFDEVKLVLPGYRGYTFGTVPLDTGDRFSAYAIAAPVAVNAVSASDTVPGARVVLAVPAKIMDAGLVYGIATIAIASLLVLVAFVLIGRSLLLKLTSPINALVRAVVSVGKGDYSARVPPQDEGEREIALLTDAFNGMAEALDESRARAEGSLRAAMTARANLEDVVHSMGEVLVVADRAGRITMMNEVGRTLFPDTDTPDVAALLAGTTFEELWARTAASAPEPLRLDGEAVLPKGHRRLKLSATLLRDASALVIVADDVTDRLMMEAELRSAQKLEAIGRLAAGIAHEINTPIQFVMDTVTFLRDAFTDLSTTVVADDALLASRTGEERDAAMAAAVRTRADCDVEYIIENIPGATDTALKGLERVAEIVRSVKRFAHPDGEQRKLVDLNEELDSTITIAHNEIKYVADVERVAGDVPLVPCNAGEINQVFLNLLVNAAHAIADSAAPGGERPRGTIRVSTVFDGEAVVVSIADTGTGIPDAVQPRIFEPFFTTKSVGRGTGQGLAIAKAVVEKHGGTITFETAAGAGTTFHVRLPAQSIERRAA